MLSHEPEGKSPFERPRGTLEVSSETELNCEWVDSSGSREESVNSNEIVGSAQCGGTSWLAELLLSSQGGFLLYAVGVVSSSQIRAIAMFMLLITGTHDVPNWRNRMIWFLAGVHGNRCMLMLMSVDAVSSSCSWGLLQANTVERWQELLSGLRDVAASSVFIQMSCSRIWGTWAAGRGYGFDSYVQCLVHMFTGHCTLCVTM
jgi:hypothetical protein